MDEASRLMFDTQQTNVVGFFYKFLYRPGEFINYLKSNISALETNPLIQMKSIFQINAVCLIRQAPA